MVTAMPEPYLLIIVVGAVFVLAGLVKGVVGLGLPTVAMGLLGLVMLPAEAAAILLCPPSSPISGSCSPAPMSQHSCGACGR
jgi:uncharacterized membrane protein YfcA